LRAQWFAQLLWTCPAAGPLVQLTGDNRMTACALDVLSWSVVDGNRHGAIHLLR
jgi:hypothetical protein